MCWLAILGIAAAEAERVLRVGPSGQGFFRLQFLQCLVEAGFAGSKRLSGLFGRGSLAAQGGSFPLEALP